MGTQGSSRIAYVFTIVVWIFLLSMTIIMYNHIITMNVWEPATNAWIDKIYLGLKCIVIASLIVSITNLIFREVRHSNAMGNIVIRRFLPIVRFIVTAAIWIISVFSLLESLHINTSNVLAGAGIGGVLFALAGKDIVTNLFGSLSILLSRTFDIGELIRIHLGKGNAYEGIVEEITLNYTKITNKTGEVVFVPNRIMYAEVVENISRQRFKSYKYVIPFKKTGGNPEDIKKQLKIIEGKIYEYSPIEVKVESENPNSNDFTYIITVNLPEENDAIDAEIREFLIDYIFPKEK